MSSILTNTSSMVALQTLKGINQNLNKTQQEISTGKSISSAKDNSAIWAISKVMESDVAGFKAIGDSLSLGESSVAVARNASESITDLLTEIKSKVVAAQEENVDRSKIQTDISKLQEQITSITDAAQFNGLNLLKGTDDVKILSSLDRGSDGTVSSRQITIERQNLEQTAGTFGSGALTSMNDVTNGGSLKISNSQTLTVTATTGNIDLDIGGQTFTLGATGTVGDDAATLRTEIQSKIDDGNLKGFTVTGTGDEIILTSKNADDVAVTATGATGAGTIDGIASSASFDSGTSIEEGHSFRMTVDGTAYEVVAGASDSYETVAKSLANKISADSDDTDIFASAVNDGGVWSVKMENRGAAAVIASSTEASGGTVGGGLEALKDIDVSTQSGASAALTAIEGLIQTSIDAAASYGSAQSRIETQSDFISKLTDSLKGGIGTMVDADMEETSARLQALQVQQQLGIQSLSIANQAPQSIMSLFR